MDEATVSMARYAGRLFRESAKLGWRVTGILGGVVAGSLWEAAKEGPRIALEVNERRDPVAVTSYSEAWDEFNEGNIGAAEMYHYRERYEED